MTAPAFHRLIEEGSALLSALPQWVDVVLTPEPGGFPAFNVDPECGLGRLVDALIWARVDCELGLPTGVARAVERQRQYHAGWPMHVSWW